MQTLVMVLVIVFMQLIGFVGARLIFRKEEDKLYGNIVLTSNQDGEIYAFLELNDDMSIGELAQKKEVSLGVKYESQD